MIQIRFAVLLVLMLCVVLGLVLSTAHIRYSHNEEGKYAWFIRLPGWQTAGSPEQTVNLQEWVGTKLTGLTVLADGKQNLEIEASAALKSIDLFQDYQLRQSDGHWVLHKPATTWRYFTLRANYRVGPWTQAK